MVPGESRVLTTELQDVVDSIVFEQ